MKETYNSSVCQNTNFTQTKPVRWILQIKVGGVWFNQDHLWDSMRDACEAGVMMSKVAGVEKTSVQPE